MIIKNFNLFSVIDGRHEDFWERSSIMHEIGNDSVGRKNELLFNSLSRTDLELPFIQLDTDGQRGSERASK